MAASEAGEPFDVILTDMQMPCFYFKQLAQEVVVGMKGEAIEYAVGVTAHSEGLPLSGEQQALRGLRILPADAGTGFGVNGEL